ncbi:uncharacterized protein B0J16DRAFT_343352 [Fusarium flagelliforme]|uniref:uncharacterized protein n=1 Tax=Fusarium flagelliforme TaxID=2675880 RepID=UPI001E8D34B1|nr:uncharacterized protein B0J16DRAFT_343352 [Fusarium flagelliforme]KAH7186193.1 hypothetical protein B0J16DRAFT_343352 [Fusarium flagelliforme]
MVAIKNLLDSLTSQCDNVPNHFELLTKEWRDKLEVAFEGLKRSANSLSLAIDAGLYAGNESETRQTEVITSLDQLVEHIRSAAGQISLPNQPCTAVSLSFIVSEINSANLTSCRVVCPRAYFSERSDMEFQCRCRGAPHESLLCYRSM